MNIVLIGFMGSGKSTAGKIAARKLGFEFCDLDKLIEEQTGKTIAGIFESLGEAGFRSIEREILLELLDKDNRVISAGGGAACQPGLMTELNKKSITVYLYLNPEMIFHRLKNHTSHRPLLRGKNENELMAYIRDTLAIREPFYNQASIVINADCPTPYDLAERIIFHLPKQE